MHYLQMNTNRISVIYPNICTIICTIICTLEVFCLHALMKL